MVKVSIEMRYGAIQFSVAVQAESIERALRLVAVRYPKSDVRVRFPIDPAGFFVKVSTARARVVGLEQRDRLAA
jgi:hypothetical protein